MWVTMVVFGIAVVVMATVVVVGSKPCPARRIAGVVAVVASVVTVGLALAAAAFPDGAGPVV